MLLLGELVFLHGVSPRLRYQLSNFFFRGKPLRYSLGLVLPRKLLTRATNQYKFLPVSVPLLFKVPLIQMGRRGTSVLLKQYHLLLSVFKG